MPRCRPLRRIRASEIQSQRAVRQGYGLCVRDSTPVSCALLACKLLASYGYGNLRPMDTQDDRASVTETTTISLRVSTDLYDRFKLAAEADHRSIAGEVRYLIERRVEDTERTAA